MPDQPPPAPPSASIRDVLIVGQGLAGTALAWMLIERGCSIAIVDPTSTESCSKVAAGLVTPITGLRGRLSWGWEAASPMAELFYRRLEAETRTRFWYSQPALRLFDSPEEQSAWRSASTDERARFIAEYTQSDCELDRQYFDNRWGGICMPSAARLDTTHYLDASRRAFLDRKLLTPLSLDPLTDFVPKADAISIPALGLDVRFVVFCLGYSPAPNPWFEKLPLVPSQGDVLTVRIPYRESRVLHRGVWLVPLGDKAEGESQTFLAGSTHRWQPLDGQPLAAHREELLRRFTPWFKLPMALLQHRTGIRPTSYDQKPLLGPSLVDARFWTLNGLGTKGSLLAPWCAQLVSQAILDGTPIDPRLLWNRRQT